MHPGIRWSRARSSSTDSTFNRFPVLRPSSGPPNLSRGGDEDDDVFVDCWKIRCGLSKLPESENDEDVVIGVMTLEVLQYPQCKSIPQSAGWMAWRLEIILSVASLLVLESPCTVAWSKEMMLHVHTSSLCERHHTFHAQANQQAHQKSDQQAHQAHCQAHQHSDQ